MFVAHYSQGLCKFGIINSIKLRLRGLSKIVHSDYDGKWLSQG